VRRECKMFQFNDEKLFLIEILIEGFFWFVCLIGDWGTPSLLSL
jgi:hypothetical protein